MARAKRSSPKVTLTITPENYDRAVKSNSGGCLIADAIKEQGYTGVTVDMATIRFTDQKAGQRYTYLTSPTAQHCLLSFDQGWPNPVSELTIQRAVKIDTIQRPKNGPKSKEGTRQRALERVAALEEKVANGSELTKAEKSSLAQSRNPRVGPDRPSSRGPMEITTSGVVVGGAPLVQGPPHPNLLRGRNRHFGAKLADPGQAFREAVEAAVEEKLNGQAE